MMLQALLLSCTIIFVGATSSTDRLIAVVQLFRHGQRTPLSFYPTDPYGDLETYWGGLGYGQLTNEGKRKHLELGQYSRTRYSGWLETSYSNSIIQVQTTDIDRTHMSAQSNLYGLFPATGTQVWSTHTNWQPIPIHPSDIRIVNIETYDCPAYTTLFNSVDTTEAELVEINTVYASAYEYMTNYSGLNVTSYEDVYEIFDPLYIENEIGYALPSWTSAVYPEPISFLTAKFFQKYTYTTQMKRLFTGPLLYTIFNYFTEMAANATSSPKYQMYSCHDSNIFAILDAVDQTPETPVPFHVSLWFELRVVNLSTVVNLWMRSGTDVTKLNIAGCALDCPLTTAKTLLSDILIDVDTFETECAATTT